MINKTWFTFKKIVDKIINFMHPYYYVYKEKDDGVVVREGRRYAFQYRFKASSLDEAVKTESDFSMAQNDYRGTIVANFKMK